MKKLIILVVVLASLFAMSLAVSADIDTLLDLSEVYPAETVAFGAWRVDDNTIDSIDDLLMGLARRVRGGVEPEEVSLRAALDEEVDDLQEGETFESFVRSWLGDTVAVGLIVDEAAAANIENIDGPEDLPIVWAIDITNSGAAQEFIAAVLLDSGDLPAISEMNGYTLYELDIDFEEGIDYHIAVAEDIMVGGTPGYVATIVEENITSSLVDDDTFNETLELLEADDYAALGYVNLTSVIELIGEANAEDFDLGGFTGSLGGQAYGLTMLDGRTLTVDIVQQVQDISSLGFAIPDLGTVDIDFTRRIPASAPLVLHGTNLKAFYDAAVANAAAAEELGAEGDVSQEMFEEMAQELNEATGLDLEADIINWMTGDYIVFLDIRKGLEDATSIFSVLTELPVEFGFVIDASADPEAAARVINVLEDVLNKAVVQLSEDEFNTTEVTITREEIARTNALVVSVSDPSSGIPFPIEMILSSNEEVAVFGTRSSVTAMLLSDGGLSSDATYVDATSVFVAEPGIVAYIGFPSLLRLVNLISAASDEPTGILVQDILSLFSHWTITSGVDPDGTSRSRLTITIAPEE